jgi:FixJ family two-component response regulator
MHNALLANYSTVIYIIDDDRCVLRGFNILFKSAGFESVIFDSAEEFLKTWVHKETDILVLDINMPGMTGTDLLNYLGKRDLQVPVILITGYDEPASRACASRYGTLAYLLKPVESKTLLELIKQASDSFR